MTNILHDRLPCYPWDSPQTARLPGIQPLPEGSFWLRVDEVFAGQMAQRDQLIARDAPVHGLLPKAMTAAAELYDVVLAKLAQTPGYKVGQAEVQRPDGQVVALCPDLPLLTLGRLVQEDLCLLQASATGEYHLTGAILCFPASWTLAEKLGKPMLAIHSPVPEYNPDLARRVDRLFQAIRPEQPLWRMNHNLYASADLFHPRTESAPRLDIAPNYLRAELQCLLRLPQTNAVVFSIHTYLMRLTDLPGDPLRSLLAAHERG